MKNIILLSLLLVAFSGKLLYAQSNLESADSPTNDNKINTAAEVNEVDNSLSFEDLLLQLTGAKLKETPDILEQMQEVDADKSLPVFQRLLEGELHFTKENKRIVAAIKKTGSEYDLVDVFSDELISTASKSDIVKVKTNNRLRKSLRAKIASLTLFSEDTSKRLESATNMLNSMDDDKLELLKQAQLSEKSSDVLNIIEQGIALGELDSIDSNEQLEAVKRLKGSLQPAVKNKLESILTTNDAAEGNEIDSNVLAEASKSLQSINSKVEFYGYLERIFFGLSLGSILLLVAAGLAITFGVMGVINMAHGELIMLGAYTTYVIQLLMPNHIGLSIAVALPAAFIVSGLFGIAMERSIIQFLKGRPLETLLATFGVSLALQQLVRTVFSPQNRQVINPDFMSGSLQINPVFSVTFNRLYILIFSLIVFFMLLLILKKTSLGLYVRAVSQNRNMAKAIGIRSEWVDAMTFGLGSGIAGLAGVALSQITNVGPNLGQTFIIDSFMVVVFGGVGNLWGTLVGAFTLGSLNKFLEPATGAVLANIIVLVGIILFIQKRPRGLFPQKGRGADS